MNFCRFKGWAWFFGVVALGILSSSSRPALAGPDTPTPDEELVGHTDNDGSPMSLRVPKEDQEDVSSYFKTHTGEICSITIGFGDRKPVRLIEPCDRFFESGGSE